MSDLLWLMLYTNTENFMKGSTSQVVTVGQQVFSCPTQLMWGEGVCITSPKGPTKSHCNVSWKWEQYFSCTAQSDVMIFWPICNRTLTVTRLQYFPGIQACDPFSKYVLGGVWACQKSSVINLWRKVRNTSIEKNVGFSFFYVLVRRTFLPLSHSSSEKQKTSYIYSRSRGDI